MEGFFIALIVIGTKEEAEVESALKRGIFTNEKLTKIIQMSMNRKIIHQNGIGSSNGNHDHFVLQFINRGKGGRAAIPY